MSLSSINYIPAVLVCVACARGCTEGPGVLLAAMFAAGGADATGGRVVVVGGGLVGYLRVAEPAAFAPFDAEAPMFGVQGAGRGSVVEM